MLWLLICAVAALVGSNWIAPQDSSYMEREDADAPTAKTMKPHIYYCRSPNMEDFTCWWRPLDNVSSDSRDHVSYVLTYSIDKEPMTECPDYVTGGPHSCHFDKRHTSVWSIYCMTVTAATPLWNYTSHEHCLDVADIVQMEAPVNLSYTLTEAGEDEVGHTARLSWTYPVPSALQYDWITLLYELQYRHVAKNPDNWKVKQRLREPHIELLGLPPGDYVLRVRCRSRNSDLWSRWSATLSMSIPAKPPAGKMLVLILMTGFGMVVLLAISFGILPQSKRIRAYFLPPIPKPRIIGIDPLLLKMGHIEEINRHFSSFHGYRPPSYAEEVWDRVSTGGDDDNGFPVPPTGPLTDPQQSDSTDDHHHLQKVAAAAPPPPQSDDAAAAPLLLDSLYVRSPASQHCPAPAPVGTSTPPLDVACTTGRLPCEPWPGIVFLPGSGYSMMGCGAHLPGGGDHQPPAAVAPAVRQQHSTQPDFYTCVQIMSETGEVHLVPCLSPTHTPAVGAIGEEAPGWRDGEEEVEEEEEEEGGEEEEEEKKKQLAERWGRKTAPSERGDVAPLLPVDNQG